MQGCKIFNLQKAGIELLIPISGIQRRFDLKKTSKLL